MANKECEKISKLIPLYIDSMLSDTENDQVVKHLDKCPDCRSEYNYLKAIIGTAKELPEREIPKDFHKNLMEKVKSETRYKKKRYTTLRHISAGVAAAAVVAISFVALSEVGEPQNVELSDQYITSRLSDEPIQKETRNDMLDDRVFTAEEKSTNREKSKTAKTSEAPKEAVTEVKEKQTAEPLPATASLDEEIKVYTTAMVTITDDNRDAVLEVLSDFEKDETGYIVEDIEVLIEKLKKLGAIVTMSNNSTNTQNYVVIK